MNDFLKDLLERVIATAAECLIGVLSTAEILGDINWTYALSACAVACLLTALKCIYKWTYKGEE